MGTLTSGILSLSSGNWILCPFGSLKVNVSWKRVGNVVQLGEFCTLLVFNGV